MDTALGSVGGICVGNREIVDHQRLSGAGYCFSASAPPFLSAAACTALSLLRSDPKILTSLAKNAEQLHKGLASIKGLRLLSEEITPVMHLVLDPPLESRDAEVAIVLEIANKCLHRGVGVTASKFSIASDPLEDPREGGGAPKLQPSLRVCASATLKAKDITQALTELKKAVAEVLTPAKLPRAKSPARSAARSKTPTKSRRKGSE
jgi:serine palmitoyltransferase